MKKEINSVIIIKVYQFDIHDIFGITYNKL